MNPIITADYHEDDNPVYLDTFKFPVHLKHGFIGIFDARDEESLHVFYPDEHIVEGEYVDIPEGMGFDEAKQYAEDHIDWDEVNKKLEEFWDDYTIPDSDDDYDVCDSRFPVSIF